MRTILSAQQLAFYKNNGFIEFKIPHEILFSEKRDQWREDENLFRFIKNKLGKPALELSHQKQIRFGVTFWVTVENKPDKGCSIQELISIQDIEIACVLSPNPIIPEKRSPLGILPIPQGPQNALFFNPKFILDWPNAHGNLFFVPMGIWPIKNKLWVEKEGILRSLGDR